MHVAVIGAGPAGLPFLKELREAGHDAVCFEASDHVGGNFARAYDGARLVSSNLVTAFSDFREPRESRARFWDFNEYAAYLNDYADHFDLRPHIRFETRVTRVEPAGESLSEGVVLTAEPATGEASRIRFDRVAVCTGSHHKREVPSWPGDDIFEGEILHHQDFMSASRFAGARVLVVGAGESGSDLAYQISRVAAASGISVRHHTGHIVWRNPSDLQEGWPNRGAADLDTSRAHHSLPSWYGPVIARHRFENLKPIPGTANTVIEKIAEINIAQGTSALNKFGLKNAGMVRAIVEHGCRRFPGIERLERDRVVFVDGQEFECDYLICATGYTVAFPALEESFPVAAMEACRPRFNLYRHAVHPDLGPEIFWGGFARPAFGAIPPISEMQARWFALLCSGERSLPSPEKMRKVIKADNERALKQFPEDAERIANLVDYLHILDDIAGMIGCRPPQRLWLTDRALWRKIMVGPITGAQYRLRGPGAKPEMARESLRRTPVPPGAGGYIRTMVKFKLASLVPWFGRRYRLTATW
jgi:dimethylaniline monooxygenase (N-oxide forming)